MSINVYLKDEVAKSVVTKERFHSGGEMVDYYFTNIKISFDRGRYYLCLNEPTDKIPTVLSDMVEEISLLVYIKKTSGREMGIYRYGSAEAEVENASTYYSIKIVGKKMEDISQLFRQIKVGSIRPNESYEGQQLGLSRTELEAKVTKLQNDLNNANDNLVTANKKLNLFLDYSLRLGKSRIPITSKGVVQKKILKIIGFTIDK